VTKVHKFTEDRAIVFCIKPYQARWRKLVSAESLRTLARILQETLQRLEASADVDPHDPAFISFQSSMLSRAAALIEQADELETGIPITAPPEQQSEPTAPLPDKLAD
jgi:hypothetical protein